MRHWVLGGCQKLARRILKNVCCPLWPVVKLGSFLLWMVGCQCDNITKLVEKKKTNKRKKTLVTFNWKRNPAWRCSHSFLYSPSTSRVCELFLHAEITVSEPFSHLHLMQLWARFCKERCASAYRDAESSHLLQVLLVVCACRFWHKKCSRTRRWSISCSTLAPVDPLPNILLLRTFLLVCACVYSPLVSSFDLFCLRFNMVMVMHMTWETCTSCSTTQAGGFDCSLDQIRHFFQVLHEFLELMMSYWTAILRRTEFFSWWLIICKRQPRCIIIFRQLAAGQSWVVANAAEEHAAADQYSLCTLVFCCIIDITMEAADFKSRRVSGFYRNSEYRAGVQNI